MTEGPGSVLRPAAAPSLLYRVLLVGGLLSVVLWMSRGLWFIDDDWDFLTQRTIGDLDAYLQPHSGHWTVPLIPQFRFLYGAVGMDYFPWYHLPRFLAAGLLALLIWRSFDRRGAAPVVATAGVAVLLVLDAAAGHRSVSVGNYIVIAALIVVGHRLAADPPPGVRDQVIVAIALLAAICSFSTGPILLAASVVVVVGARRLRVWWRALIGPVVVYATWSVAYGPKRGAGLSVSDLPDVVSGMFTVLANSQASLFGAPYGLGAVAAGVEIVLVAWWAWKRRLDRFDALVIVTVVGFLAATAIERLTGSFSVADTDRYGYLPIVGLALLVVPRFPAPKTRSQTAAVVLVGAALVAVNLVGTHDRAGDLAAVAADRRIRVETAAVMLAAGEPAVEDSWITVPLTVEGLQRLVDDGWSPTPSPSPAETLEARGLLRVGLGPDSQLDDPVDTDGPGCQPLDRADVVELTVDETTSFTATASPPTRLIVRWEQGDQVGERAIAWSPGRGAFHGRAGRFGLAGPEAGEAQVTITAARAKDLTVCLPGS